MTTDGAFTPLESLVLVQIIAAHGANGSSFRRIADWIRQTGKTPQTSAQGQSTDEGQDIQQLQELYVNILKNEAKQKLKSSTVIAAEDTKNNGRLSPRKRTPSPKLYTVKDAEQYSHLLPDVVNKLYQQYKDHAISEIREQEEKYDQLVEQFRQLEQKIKDEEVRSSEADPPVKEASVHETQKEVQTPSRSSSSKQVSGDSAPDQGNVKSRHEGEHEQSGQRSRPSTAEARIDSILNHNEEPVKLSPAHEGQPQGPSTRKEDSIRQHLPSQPDSSQRPALPLPESAQLSRSNARFQQQQQQQQQFSQDQRASFDPNSSRALDVGSQSPPPFKDYGSQHGLSPVHLPPPPGVAPVPPPLPPPVQWRSVDLQSQQTTSTLPPSPRHLPSPDRNRQPVVDPRYQPAPLVPSQSHDSRYTPSTHQFPISRQPPYGNYHHQHASQPYGVSHTLPTDAYSFSTYTRHSVESPQVLDHTSRQRQESQAVSHRSSLSATVNTHRPGDTYNYQTPTQQRDRNFAASQPISVKAEEIVTPGSSTRWKAAPSVPVNVVPLDRPRGRSLSPLSDREPSPSTRQPLVSGKSQTSTAAAPLSARQVSQSSPKARGPRGRHLKNISQTPPTRATSSTARTRSQSVASQSAENMISVTTKRARADDDNGTPGVEAVDLPEAESSFAGRRGGPRTRKRKFSSVSREDDLLTLEQTRDSSQPQGMIIATRNFNKMAQPIMHNITTHKHASLFANPVKDRDAEGYTSIIRSPQDLKSIRAAISAGQRAVAAAMSQTPQPSPGGSTTGGTITLPYSPDLVPPRGIVNGDQLEQEIMRMLANAVMFNPGEGEDGGIIKDTREMFRTVEQAMEGWRQTERLLREGREGDVDSSTVSEEGSSLKRRRVESVDYSKQL